MLFWHTPLDFCKSWRIVLPSFGGVDFCCRYFLINVQGADAQSLNKIVWEEIHESSSIK
jgi:hypothetical protein